ncbi:MAG: hypothetical protein CMJ64_01945 [Planctomycetaceae bacterium]|nr:hypothetical protein [Planctomycetaceae bacterium]
MIAAVEWASATRTALNGKAMSPRRFPHAEREGYFLRLLRRRIIEAHSGVLAWQLFRTGAFAAK